MGLEVDCVHRRSLSIFTALSSMLMVIAVIVAMFLEVSKPPTSMIQIANDSGLPLQNVRVNGIPFGDLPVNGVSGYYAVTPAYRYASLQLEVAGEKFESIAEDYVGETPLGKGNFTYRVRRQEVKSVPYFEVRVPESAAD